MRNDEIAEAPRASEPEARRTDAQPDPEHAPLAAPLASPTLPLLILASDDDAVCVDDLCLPADARP